MKNRDLKKEAEIWAEKLLECRDKFREDDKFYNMLMFGTTHPEITPNTFINLRDGTCRFERLTKEELIEKYGYLLSEEDVKKLRNER